MLLPRRRLNLDSSWAPKRVATTTSSGGLQKAQSVQSLVPQGEELGAQLQVWGVWSMGACLRKATSWSPAMSLCLPVGGL